MLDIYIGYDGKESVAYHTLVQSIINKSSRPIRITPVALNNIPEYERKDKGSTEFAFSRFLVPYLNNYSGLALFIDCDMIFLDDPVKLFSEWDYHSAVQVVKHDYKTNAQIKFLGQGNKDYPKKNWSSVMLFNCSHYHTRRLTLEYVNKATPKGLHQFEWTDRVGDLSPCWNYLVGEPQPDVEPKLVHYTLGGPYFREYQDCEYSEEWFHAFKDMSRCDQ